MAEEDGGRELEELKTRLRVARDTATQRAGKYLEEFEQRVKGAAYRRCASLRSARNYVIYDVEQEQIAKVLSDLTLFEAPGVKDTQNILEYRIFNRGAEGADDPIAQAELQGLCRARVNEAVVAAFEWAARQ